MTITIETASRMTRADVTRNSGIDHQGKPIYGYKFSWPKDGEVEYMRDVRLGIRGDDLAHAAQQALYFMEERYHGGQNEECEFLKNGGKPWPRLDEIMRRGFDIPPKRRTA